MTAELPTSPEGVLALLGINIASVTGTQITANCPFHADRRPSFRMSTDEGLWICFSCGRKGNLRTLIAQFKEGTDPNTFLREVRHKAVRKRQPAVKRSKSVEDEIDPPPMVYARYEAFRRPPQWALDERFIGSGSAERYGLRWDKGWIIPIWSPDGTGGWNGLWGWQFKRLNLVRNYPRSIRKSETLFGLREIGRRVVDRVVLVESPLDVVRLASAGIAAVAAFGAFCSNTQLRLLTESAERIVLALDNDLAGYEQTQRIHRRLLRIVPTTVVQYPSGVKDPGDLDDDQIEEVFSDVQR